MTFLEYFSSDMTKNEVRVKSFIKNTSVKCTVPKIFARKTLVSG